MLDQSTATQWQCVETSLNPADKASRGITVDALLKNDRWSQGPPFLKQLKETWPQRPGDISEIPDRDPEVKKTVEVFANKVNDQSGLIGKAIEKISSRTRLKKVMVWVLRCKQNLSGQSQRCKAHEVISYQSDVSKITPLNVSKVNEAEMEIVKFVQKQSLKEELLAVSRVSRVCKETEEKTSSSIYKLDPVLKNDLLHVRGRLHHAPIENNAKHPVTSQESIMPSS